MLYLPIERIIWTKINCQFLKGGFDWYNQKIPDWKRWYFNYYIHTQKTKAIRMARFRKTRYSKVTKWLRNIETFEDVDKRYKQEDKIGNNKK